jgi:hypothetical protein
VYLGAVGVQGTLLVVLLLFRGVPWSCRCSGVSTSGPPSLQGCTLELWVFRELYYWSSFSSGVYLGAVGVQGSLLVVLLLFRGYLGAVGVQGLC